MMKSGQVVRFAKYGYVRLPKRKQNDDLESSPRPGSAKLLWGILLRLRRRPYADGTRADGTRAEGLLAGYQLAVKVGDSAKSERFLSALKKLAWATLHWTNTLQSVYSVPNPAMTLGGIRFKHTRPWFRVDTIHHVAGFY